MKRDPSAFPGSSGLLTNSKSNQSLYAYLVVFKDFSLIELAT